MLKEMHVLDYEIKIGVYIRMSNLVYSFPDAISSPHRGVQCTKLEKEVSKRDNQGTF